MKKLSLLLITFLMAGVMYGQFHIGPQIGYTSSNLSLKGSDIGNGLRNNFLAGVFMRIGKKIYVQPELNYMIEGSVFKYPSLKSGLTPVEQDIKVETIQIPLSLGWRIINAKIVNVRIFAGATVNFNSNTTIDTKDPDNSIGQGLLSPLKDADFKKSHWKYQVGAGVDVLMFAIDVKYYGNITNLVNGNVTYNNATHTIDAGSNVFEVTLGWKIF